MKQYPMHKISTHPSMGISLRLTTFLMLFLFTSTLPAFTQTEAWYIEKLSQELNGQREFKVENGRVDIVTDEYAIEVEWAEKWKHSIGQSLWYGMQTNKKAGIILIMKDADDYKHGIRLQSTIDNFGMGDQIKVWFYPQDFGGNIEADQRETIKYKESLQQNDCHYWFTKSSGKRHNAGCRYFGSTKGRCADAGEGVACKVCGG